LQDHKGIKKLNSVDLLGSLSTPQARSMNSIDATDYEQESSESLDRRWWMV
jgi:hypothetical protein